jgi:SAM-dependent methyltransferase
MKHPVRDSADRWKQGGGYYFHDPEALQSHPLLPDLARLRDRRILELFDRHGGVQSGSRVLEAGCGGSPWLPFLAVERKCQVFGLEREPHAAELARANLKGAGADGVIFCRDAFDLEGNADLAGKFDVVYSMGLVEHFDDPEVRLHALGLYLAPGGRIITTVPNMRGANWLLQRLGNREILEMHVIYDPERLARAHQAAGLHVLASGHAGFFDGHMTACGHSSGIRRWLHAGLCRTAGRMSEAWLRLGHGTVTPELGWWSPHVFCVAERVASPVQT